MISDIIRFALISILLSIATIIHANTIFVDSTDATMGMTSLRTAVANAISGDTIVFDASIDGDTIFLITEITLNKNLVIIGNDTTSTIIDGMGTSRIFHIPAGDTVAIHGVTLQNGNGVGAISSGNGGAILNQGVAAFTNTNISGNSASGQFRDGGGVANRGTATFTNTTISGNSTSRFGGGVTNFNTATFTNTTISGNSARDGGGVVNISVAASATATFTSSTISGNTASRDGGGVANLFDGTAIFTNTTISGNTASRDGGGVTNLFDGTAIFTNTTISGNTASRDGGGVTNLFDGTATFTNTIVAKNTDDGSGPDIFGSFGTITDGGQNLIGDNTSVTTEFPTGPLVGTTGSEVDPLFVMDVPANDSLEGDLRLTCGSSAIDAGTQDTMGLNLGATDILGLPRIVGGTIDIGAIERQVGETLTVTNISDNDQGSLRATVLAACPGDTIRFSSAINGDTIKLTTGEIVLDTSIVIIGNDPTATASQGSGVNSGLAPQTIIDGMATSRIFHIPSGDTVAIHGVTLQNGNGVGTIPSGRGGAILNQGEATFTNSTISGNTAFSFGGGVYNFRGEATFTNTTISRNSASEDGGGVFNGSNSTATFTNTTVSGNTASGQGGGVYNAFTNATSTFTNTTISGNSASEDGGGVYNSEEATFTNTTISGNSASFFGGGVTNIRGMVTFTNTTISGNTARDGGGVDNLQGMVIFTNTIVAKNTDERSRPDILDPSGTITDGGHNLIGDTTSVGSFFTSSTLLGSTSMPLDPLFVMNVPANDSLGGDLRLACGSPAIDAGTIDTMGLNLGATDILGLPRIVGTVDIGAYERPADTGTKIVTTLADDGPGSLRFIATSACPGDTIRFDSGIDGDTIFLITEITLNKNLVILGNDTTRTIIDGMANSRIFHIPSGETVAIHGVTLQNGNGVGAISSGNGGAILNQGVATFTNTTISGNTASFGGGVSNGGTATFINTTISGNTASRGGGGVLNSRGRATFTNTTISGNTADDEGGGVFNIGTATFTNTTISGNTTSGGGGGVFIRGSNATATFTNSTISGNTASRDGGGVFIRDSDATATFTNTIVAKNTNDGPGPDISRSSGTIMDEGHNLIGDTTGVANLFTVSTLKGGSGANALDPLFIMNVSTGAGATTGGDLRLQACSPAIDAGNTAALPEDIFDLDGDMDVMELHPLDLQDFTRVRNMAVDIGAYEFQSTLFTLSCMDTTLYLDMSGMVTLDTSIVIDVIVSACLLDTVYIVDPILDCDDTGSPVSAEIVAVNERGDTLRCMPMITVLDTISPVVTCMDTTIYLDTNGTVTIDSSYIMASVSDGCGIMSVIPSKTSFSCADIGSNTLSLTASDKNGNTSICTATVTVRDTISPVLTCMDTTIYLDANGAVSIDSSYIMVSVNDVCGIMSVVPSKTSFSCANIGTNTVTLMANDNNGNSSMCSAIVTVLDTISPVLTCMDTTVYLDANGTVSIDSSFIMDSVDDACGIISVVPSKTTFSCADIGPNTLTLTARDKNGNTSICTATVTVRDTISPVLTCMDTTIYLDANGAVSISSSYIMVSVNDACGIMSVMPSKTSFSCTDIGTNTVTLMANDNNGNSSMCSAIVTVLDTISPVLTCMDTTIYLDANGAVSIDSSYIMASVSDGCDIMSVVPSKTTFSCTDIGANTVTLTARDKNGNTSICTAIVTVLDTISPVLTCMDTTVYLDANGAVIIDSSYIMASVNDACGIMSVVPSKTTFSCTDIGTNTVTLMARDKNGNTSICTATVTVRDTISPVVTCMDTTIYLDANGAVSIDSSYIMGSVSDVCGIMSVVPSKTSFSCIDIGTNTVTLTASDNNGNSSMCSAIVTVLDTISPVLTCMDTTIYLDANGAVSIDSSYIMASVNDTCGIMSVIPSKTSFSCTDIGTNTVTLTASDKNGNTSICTATVTLRDTISPVVTCMDTTVYLDANGMAIIDTNFVVTSATDACSAVILLLGQTRFTCDDLGTQEVIVSATDAAGNIGTCVSMVTVLKTPLMVTTINGPSAICPDLSQIAYSAVAISDAAAYQWSYDGTGVTINNQGSNEITLDFTSDVTAGTLTVDVIDVCGDISSSATYDIAIRSGEFCALTDCTRENIYLDDKLLGLIGSIDLYRASIMIETNATVPTGRNLIFKAGQEVIFYPGFTVEQTGLLEAIIEQCE